MIDLINFGYGEGRTFRGEDKEDHTDGVLHGGDGGVVACIVFASACSHRGCVGAMCSHIKLHLCPMLWTQRAFQTIRFQELLDRYSSRLRCQISHYYLYASLYLLFAFISFLLFFLFFIIIYIFFHFPFRLNFEFLFIYFYFWMICNLRFAGSSMNQNSKLNWFFFFGLSFKFWLFLNELWSSCCWFFNQIQNYIWFFIYFLKRFHL